MLKNVLPEGPTKKDLKHEGIVGISDNILKNEAIWLWKKGYTLERLEQEIRPIFDSRGWPFGSLKGWFNKAAKGDIIEISIGELMAWCKTYMPALKELLPGEIEEDVLEDSNKGFMEKPEVEKPGPGIMVSSFVKKLLPHIKDNKEIFYKGQEDRLVKIGEYEDKTNKRKMTGFISIGTADMINFIEERVRTGKVIRSKKHDDFFEEGSLSQQSSAIIMKNKDFVKTMLPINRFFTVPNPYIINGGLVFPKKGYDPTGNPS